MRAQVWKRLEMVTVEERECLETDACCDVWQRLWRLLIMKACHRSCLVMFARSLPRWSRRSQLSSRFVDRSVKPSPTRFHLQFHRHLPLRASPRLPLASSSIPISISSSIPISGFISIFISSFISISSFVSSSSTSSSLPSYCPHLPHHLRLRHRNRHLISEQAQA